MGGGKLRAENDGKKGGKKEEENKRREADRIPRTTVTNCRIFYILHKKKKESNDAPRFHVGHEFALSRHAEGK